MPTTKTYAASVVLPQDQLKEFTALVSDETISAVLNYTYLSGGLPGWILPAESPVTLGGAASFTQYQREAREAFRHRVTAHSIYKRLAADSNFAVALELFASKAKSKTLGRYAEPFAEFRLFRIAALVVDSHASDPVVKPRLPDLEARDRTLKQLKKLIAEMDAGVRLDDFNDHLHLRASLTRLGHQLRIQLDKGKRKPRADGFAPERWYIDGIINALLGAFSEASPSLVAEISHMLGYEPNESRIERRIRAVKKQNLDAEELRFAVALACSKPLK